MSFSDAQIRRLDEILRDVLSDRAEWVESQCGCALRESKSAKNVEATSIHSAVTHVDRELQDAVLKAVYSGFPTMIPLVEEDTALAMKYRQNQGDVAFILDPIDGTQCFANGRHDYCTMAAVSVAGRMVYGSVARYHPFDWTNSLTKETTSTSSDASDSPLKIVCHYRMFRDPYLPITAKLQAANFLSAAVPLDESEYSSNEDAWNTGNGLGSNGNAILAMLDGHWDAYLAPMVNLHDFAGPLAVAQAAGATVIRFETASAEKPKAWLPAGDDSFFVESASDYPKRFRLLMARDQDVAKRVIDEALSLA